MINEAFAFFEAHNETEVSCILAAGILACKKIELTSVDQDSNSDTDIVVYGYFIWNRQKFIAALVLKKVEINFCKGSLEISDEYNRVSEFQN